MASEATEGTETLVNTYTTNSQSDASAVMLSDGGWVITWTSAGQDGSGDGIYQQRYDADGAPAGFENRINAYTTGLQNDTSVTALGDGGWLVTWTSDGQDGSGLGIYQQRYDKTGEKDGTESVVNGLTTAAQFNSAVTTLTDGGWLVTWTSNFLASPRVYQQRYDREGSTVGEETQVTDIAAVSDSSVTTALADGGWVVAWSYDNQDGGGSGGSVHQKRFDKNGVTVSEEALVNTTTTGNQSDVSITALSDGGWVVAWFGATDGDSDGIFLQRYGRNGVEKGEETQVNTYTTGTQQVPTVVGLADGGWVVTWHSSQDGSVASIHQQRYDVSGATVGNETLVNVFTTGAQLDPSVTALADGWVVNWKSQDQDGNGTGMYQRQYTDLLDPEGHADKLTGNNRNNVLIGYGGDDRLGGKRGSDILIGGYGDDTYYINSKRDDVQEMVAQGTDTIITRINFSLANDAGVENLALVGKANLRGTGNIADNVITGNNGRNIINGLSGDDRLAGHKGNDTMLGGDDADTFVFSTGWDKDKVRDFDATSPDHDILDISALKSVKTYIDLMANHTSAIHGNVVINGGRGDTIILFGVDMGDLSESHFII